MQRKLHMWLLTLTSVMLLNASLENRLADLRGSLQLLLDQLQITEIPPIRPGEGLAPAEVGKKLTAADASHFIAFKVPIEKVKRPFRNAIAKLKEDINRLGNTEFTGRPYGSLHLTLEYLVGAEGKDREMERIIKRVIKEYKKKYGAPITFEAGDIDFIGERGHFALYLPVHKRKADQPLYIFDQMLREAFKKSRIELAYADKEFIPHITLGRINVPGTTRETPEEIIKDGIRNIREHSERRLQNIFKDAARSFRDETTGRKLQFDFDTILFWPCGERISPTTQRYLLR